MISGTLTNVERVGEHIYLTTTEEDLSMYSLYDRWALGVWASWSGKGIPENPDPRVFNSCDDWDNFIKGYDWCEKQMNGGNLCRTLI